MSSSGKSGKGMRLGAASGLDTPAVPEALARASTCVVTAAAVRPADAVALGGCACCLTASLVLAGSDMGRMPVSLRAVAVPNATLLDMRLLCSPGTSLMSGNVGVFAETADCTATAQLLDSLRVQMRSYLPQGICIALQQRSCRSCALQPSLTITITKEDKATKNMKAVCHQLNLTTICFVTAACTVWVRF